MAIGDLWGRFRTWPAWAQMITWVLLWPVPLVLLAVARPRSRPFWGALAALGAFTWAVVVVSAGTDDATVEAVPVTTTTATAPATTTTRERIGTTTTEPGSLGPIPDPDDPLDGYDIAPVFTGGLTTFGAGVFDVDDMLARLEEAPATTVGGYDRALFGQWIDSDGDGCDTRAEVLRAESITPAQVDPPGCFVLAGDWRSVYDGYTTDDPTELEIDHLVALHEAWLSGAATWSPERRRAFANDLAHPGALVAVTAAMNQSKGDDDPAVWQPPNRDAWCLYAADWITVKTRWQLRADPAEITALRNMLRGCGAPPATTTLAPSTPRPPAITPPQALVPPTRSRSGCDPSYPTVCIPPAPPDLDCGDIPYRRFAVRPPDPHGFDGNDNDGIGCESD